MTEDDGPPAWPATMFPGGTGEEAVERQMELFKRFLSTGPTGLDGMGGLGSMGTGAAVFKTRVQSGGRISIPDAEREALDIDEGDIVQTVVVPIDTD
ncbi:MAG: AbrB/MazE/SpoVT family DNA-binding domain-containing protein [Haloferacaceae archaeon]